MITPSLLHLVSVSCVVTQGSLALRDDTGNGCERHYGSSKGVTWNVQTCLADEMLKKLTCS